MFVTTHDYLIHDLQNASEILETQGVVTNGTSAQLQEYADWVRGVPSFADPIWFATYISFFISSIILAYLTERQGTYIFLNYLFYGLMVFLFVLSLFTTLTNWWQNEILLKLIPNIQYQMPLFSFYLRNIGVLALFQMVACLFANQVDIDVTEYFNRKKKEREQISQDSELI